MEHSSGCLICGSNLVYSERAEDVTCSYCGATETSTARCSRRHYVCDRCHNGSANDLIERFCCATRSCSPLAMAQLLMRNPLLKMHGPEHHFLVPAVLLAACYNRTGAPRQLVTEKIGLARQRAGDVKGGFCGMLGACGAAIGAGIFVSVMSGATPLADRERRLANAMTAHCLGVIAEHTGPRCCKREVFWALIAAREFIAGELGVDLPEEPLPVCTFSSLNRECLRERCSFNAAPDGAARKG